jgi:hypothetical protein
MAEKEFIEREAVIAFLENMAASRYLIQCFENKEKFPAADVVEVVYGRWVEEEFESYIPVEVDITGNLVVHKHTIYKCSICGRTEPQKEPYCHCGAKMDK